MWLDCVVQLSVPPLAVSARFNQRLLDQGRSCVFAVSTSCHSSILSDCEGAGRTSKRFPLTISHPLAFVHMCRWARSGQAARRDATVFMPTAARLPPGSATACQAGGVSDDVTPVSLPAWLWCYRKIRSRRTQVFQHSSSLWLGL